MHRVFLARKINNSAIDRLKSSCDVDLWTERLPPPFEIILKKVQGKDGILCLLTDTINAEVFDRAGPNLRVVSNMAIGVDNIDVEEATRRSILVCNTPDVLTETTADLAFALLLAGARRLPEAAEFVKENQWKTWEPELLLGLDVYGSTLGIIGMGRIGKAVARRALGFGMSILYLSPNPPKEFGDERRIRRAESLTELLKHSDFISLHAPLNDKTRGIIGKNELDLMKPHTVLVNTARGPLIDTEALIHALKSDHIGFAALDVTDPEPLDSHHPLVGLKNCLILPHIGSASRATRKKMAHMAAENLLSALSGKRPPFVVNPEVLERGLAK